MKVTTKGRVTIPQAIRDQLNIQPGTEVDFKIEGKTVKMIPLGKTQTCGRRIVEHLHGRGTIRMSTNEIMTLTREGR